MSNQKKKKLEAAIDHLFTAPKIEAKTGPVDTSDIGVNEQTMDLTIDKRVSYPDPESLPAAQIEVVNSDPPTSTLKEKVEPEFPVLAEPVFPEKNIEQKISGQTDQIITNPTQKETEKIPEGAPEAQINASTLSVIQGDNLQVVVFTLDNQYYGIRIDTVESIIKMQAITELPHVASYIVGLTNLRGNVLPVISLRLRFGLSDQEATKNSRIIVIREEGVEAGLIVDGVTEVETIAKENIEPISEITSMVSSKYVFGIAKLDDRLIILLDLTKILAF